MEAEGNGHEDFYGYLVHETLIVKHRKSLEKIDRRFVQPVQKNIINQLVKMNAGLHAALEGPEKAVQAVDDLVLEGRLQVAQLL